MTLIQIHTYTCRQYTHFYKHTHTHTDTELEGESRGQVCGGCVGTELATTFVMKSSQKVLVMGTQLM